MDSRDFVKTVNDMTKPDNLTEDIWAAQEKLMLSYKEIEKWPVTWPLDLNHKESQLLMKDMIARTVEELAEAYETFLQGNMDNTLEEMADALHFLSEAFILAGHPVGEDILKTAKYERPYIEPHFEKFYWDAVFERVNKIPFMMWEATYQLNLARNALRNKPWKQTQMLYNKDEFEKRMELGLNAIILIHYEMGLIPEDIWVEYTKKNLANRFRIRSKY